MKRAIVIGAALPLLVPSLVVGLRAQTISPAQTNSPQAGAQNLRLADVYGRLPLSFEVNEGQTDGRVKFLSRGAGKTLFLTSTEAVLAPRTGRPVRMQLTGANSGAKILGLDRLPGNSNYFLKNDPAKWRRNVPTYGKVRYQQIYPGVDLLFYGNQRQMEYDFVVAPGGDPAQIRLAVRGAEKMWIDASGNAVFDCQTGDIRLLKPRLYQETHGVETEIGGGYVLRGRELRFVVAQYDHQKPLVIDPVLSYSTYLGGSGSTSATGIAVDASGNAYVSGQSNSIDFPGAPGNGKSQNFVVKLNSTGSAVLYSTYISGSGSELATAIAVDASGNAHVTGYTNSTDFPIQNALQPANAGGYDAFATKLDGSGNLVYSTYIGGAKDDEARAIALDSAGNAYLTGFTASTNFPGVSSASAQSSLVSSFYNAFVAKLNASGTALNYSTYLGGNAEDTANGIAVDASGEAYVVGSTNSTNFPVTTNALQPNFGGGAEDAFVTKLNATGSAFLYSTYLGGSGTDFGNAIAVDSSGNAYVAGYSNSLDVPGVSSTSIQSANSGGYDAIVAKLNSTGTALVYSTYLGGAALDTGNGIAVDSSGNTYVIGTTRSTNFAGVTSSSIQPALAGNSDAFVAQLNAAGSTLEFSTYLGGTANDSGNGIALDLAGNVYVTGDTASTNFPVTSGVLQATFGGQANAFVAKLTPSTGTATTTTVTASVNPSVFGQSVTLTATVTSSASGTPIGTVTFSDGESSIGSASLSGGQASINVSAPTAGTHFVTAAYGGDAAFAGSTSAALTQTIMQGGSSVSISVSPNPTVAGQPVALTAAVSVVAPAAGTPTGIVRFLDGTTSLGEATLSGGQATFTPPSLSAGSHAITATYAGDTNFLGSTSSAFSLTVQQTTTTTLTVSPNPATPSQPVSLAATVASSGTGTPTGIATFLDGPAILGTAPLTGGTATLTTSSFAAGTHSLTASYPGDSNFAPSSSSTTTLSVQLPPVVISDIETITVTDTPSFPDVLDFEQIIVTDQVTIQVSNTTTISIIPSGGVYGTPASGTVVVSSPTATVNGNVTLSVDGGAATALPLTGGSATFNLGVLTAGSHLLAVSFAAQGNFTASSAQATLVINPATPTVTWANPSPISYGTPLTSTQLSATASVPGTFAYTPAAGTVLSVGSNQTLSVTFHPTDSMDYTPSTANVTITVLNTGVGANVTVTPVDTTTGTTPIIVNFRNVTTAGMTGLTTASIGAPPPPGYRMGNPGVYFDISTTAAFAGTATVCISYTGIAFLNPAGPHFFHYENGAWFDHTVSIDTINKNACGTVASFSPFALFDPLPVLTITGNPASRQYGLPDPVFTASYSGFVNGDTAASLSGVLSCTSSDTAFSAVGTYAINCSGLTSPNYVTTYAAGTLTITPAPLTITANNASRPFGANNPVFIGTIAGLLNTDPISANFGSLATPESPVGTYAIVPTLTGAPSVLANYAIALVNGTLTVVPETTSLAMTVAPASIGVGQSANVTITLTAPDMVIPIDSTVLASITVTSPVASDVLSNGGVCTPVPGATPGTASCNITVTSTEPNGRTLDAAFAASADLAASSATGDFLVTAALLSQQVCIASDFRNVAVPGGSFIWFNSIFKVRDVPQQLTHVSFFNSSAQFQYTDPAGTVVTVSQPLPDAHIAIDPSATIATTTFDPVNNLWVTTIPWDLDDNSFLTGMPWTVPSAGLPADVEPVIVCGTFASDVAGIDIGWRWAAAAYASFSTDASVLSVKPMDSDHDNPANNQDRAGTPENYKQFAIPGARGKGGRNYTGSYSGRAEIE